MAGLPMVECSQEAVRMPGSPVRLGGAPHLSRTAVKHPELRRVE